MQQAKVAVIVVTFNRFDVTNLLLDSLVKAKNKSKFEVFLVDNQSQQIQWEKIQRLFNHLCETGKLKGRAVRSKTNSGFSAGNNIGLSLALNDPTFSHVCLLNNDTLVSDYWLDDLVSEARDNALVGPVSNSVGNEQVVPVDYRINGPNGYTTSAVRQFAMEWRSNHSRTVFETQMLGFFCVLGPKRLFEQVGPLDENFGIGMFEDDDYCQRCLKQGFKLLVVRYVFIHHWGSASFSKLSKVTLRKLFDRNRRYFEKCHGLNWKSPADTYPISFAQEMKSSSPEYFRKLEPQFIQTIMCQIRSGEAEKAKWISGSLLSVLILRLKHRLRSTWFAGLDFNHVRDNAKKLLKYSWLFWKTGLGLVIFNSVKRSKLPKVIIFPITELGSRQQRPQHLSRALAKLGNHVVWVNPNFPVPKNTFPFSVILSQLTQIGKGLISVISIRGIDYHNFYCSGMVASEARSAFDKIERLFPIEGAVLIFQGPFWLEMAREAHARYGSRARIVYECMDDHLGFASATEEVKMLEDAFRSEADIFVATSKKIELDLKKMGKPNSKVILVPNGVELDNFAGYQRELNPSHQEMLTIGYFGAIAEWFDMALLVDVANLLPDIRFELIGDYTFSNFDRRLIPANISLLGEKGYKDLPKLTRNWRAALIPFKITPLIIATNPVKMYEYSALGLPIISTPIPEVIESGLKVFVGNGPEEFAEAVKRAIVSDSQRDIKDRIDFAEKNTWFHRAIEFCQAIDICVQPGIQGRLC